MIKIKKILISLLALNSYCPKYECNVFQDLIDNIYNVVQSTSQSNIHINQLIAALKNTGQEIVFAIDPGEVVVHSAKAEYTRDITGKLYEKYSDIALFWKELLGASIDNRVQKGTGLTDEFIDFIYSTAAVLNPTQLTHANWADLIMFLDKTEQTNINTCFLSTMHPYYKAARETMIKSAIPSLSDRLSYLQTDNKANKLEEFLTEKRIIDPLIICIDDDSDKINSLAQKFPQAHLIQYKEGTNKTSFDIDNRPLSWRTNDEEFDMHMRTFWAPIVQTAQENYLVFFSMKTSNNNPINDKSTQQTSKL